jgi:hypothetical protein
MPKVDIIKEIKAVAKLDDSLDPVLDGTINRYVVWLLHLIDWKFMHSSQTDSSVVNQQTYTLSGANNDCGLIEELYYDGDLLKYLDPKPFDRDYNTITTPTAFDVASWTVKTKSTKGFPIVTLFGTPTAVKDLYYSYIKQVNPDDPLASLEPSMEDIVVNEMLSRFHPDFGSRQTFSDKVQKGIDGAIATYALKSKQQRSARLDEYRRMRNREINFHAGYGNAIVGRLVDPD